jgi:hypothetical protein
MLIFTFEKIILRRPKQRRLDWLVSLSTQGNDIFARTEIYCKFEENSIMKLLLL